MAAIVPLKTYKKAFWAGQTAAVASTLPFPNRRIYGFVYPGKYALRFNIDIDREASIRPDELPLWSQATAIASDYDNSSNGVLDWYLNGFWSRLGEMFPEFVEYHMKQMGKNGNVSKDLATDKAKDNGNADNRPPG